MTTAAEGRGRLAFAFGATIALAAFAGCSDDFHDPSAAGAGASSGSAGVGASGGGATGAGGTGGGGGAGAAPTTVTLTARVGAVQQAIAFVAGQDGDGDWKALEGPGGVYSLAVTTGRFGLAYVCPGESGDLIWARPEELPSLEVVCPPPSMGSTTITWTFTAVDIAAHVQMAVGSHQQYWSTTSNDAMVAPLGVWDALGFYHKGPMSEFVASAMYLERAMTVTANKELSASFSSTDAFVPPSQSYQVEGTDPNTAVVAFVDFTTKGGTKAIVSSSLKGSGAYTAVPPAKQLAGEVNVFHANNSSEAGEARVGFRTFTELAPIQMTLLPLPNAEAAIDEGSYPRPRVTLDDTEGVESYGMLISQGAGIPWTVQATAGWVGAGAKHALTMPDFGALDGWVSSWSFVTGEEMAVEAVVSHRTGGPATLLEQTPMPADIEVTTSGKVIKLIP